MGQLLRDRRISKEIPQGAPVLFFGGLIRTGRHRSCYMNESKRMTHRPLTEPQLMAPLLRNMDTGPEQAPT